ncbi:MAG: hypothetical protein F6J93_16095 [Oscillatoria sp. SIO1A7]|nr:hypothetical protein [Oscillatoria sp. SIO1A7]
MEVQLNSRSGNNIGEIVERILAYGRITPTDRYCLHRAMLSNNLFSPEEQKQIKRVCDRLHSGLLRIVD